MRADEVTGYVVSPDDILCPDCYVETARIWCDEHSPIYADSEHDRRMTG